MKLINYKKYAPPVLRISMALVFLWFGFNQIFNASAWQGFLPSYVFNLPIDPLNLILFNGIFEVIFGLLLILGLFTRLSALLLGLHLIPIMMAVGYNDVGVRDFGLMLATLTVFLYGPDLWCLDKKIKNRNNDR